MSYNFSKSRYCSGIQCPKMLWLKKNKSELFDASVLNQTILDTGNEVGDLAMALFGDFTEVPFSENLSDMIPATQKLIDEGVENIAEASFSYDNCFCSVDILQNFGNKKVALYEVKSSTSVKDIYLDDVAYQNYVLTKLGFHVEKLCLVHINNQYVRQGDLNLKELFTIEEVTEIAKDKFSEVEENIKYFRKFLEQPNEPECEVGEHCSNPYNCGFFSFCAKNLPSDDTPTVFDISRFSKAMECYKQGIITFEDVYKAGILKGKQLQQVEVAVKNLPPQIEKDSIKDFFNTLSYPLYFLDFETFNPAIPLYDNSSPFQQIVFQYSLHYQETEKGELKHTECLSYPEKDPRREIAERLCKDIPKNACVTAYNMGFEKGIIRGLANLYPDLAEHLMHIHENIKDIMIPFQKRYYYTKEMQGSYSIKYVLPALFPNEPSLNYAHLEGVHNGGEASSTFLAMQKMKDSEREIWRKRLLAYCKLDTYAMVKVLDKLKEVID
ncbi:MAG: DUF2779 domain-containing protein [Spirochaetaceae bacterium]|nr:DUF2779 domain-containing protein [Spirochaetaceae bacterium]